MKHFSHSITVSLCLALLLAACIPGIPSTTQTDPLEPARTSAAQTVEAMTTQIVLTAQAEVTLLPPTAAPTATAPALVATPITLPTETSVPTAIVTAQPPTSTTSLVCDQAEFVSETIPDGSQFLPGSIFIKTWVLRNVGSCIWTPGYLLEYTRGDIATMLSTQTFTNTNILPGQTVSIAIAVTTPVDAGKYRLDFRLRNAKGESFSFKNPASTFWVDFEVVTSTYSLGDNYCAAEWSSGAGPLSCPGNAGDTRGYVYSDLTPKLENNYQDDEIALWLGPQAIDNGYIKGVFPAQRILPNTKFEATIGCAPDSKDCNAVIALNYVEGSGSMLPLATWTETNDSTFHQVSYDLNALAGRNIRLILIVSANGSAAGDKVHLLKPVVR